MVKADNNLLPLEWIGHSFNFPVEWAQNISHESLVECALNLAKELVEKQEDLKTRIEKWKTQNAFEKNVLLAKKSKDKGNTYYSKNKFKVALEAYGETIRLSSPDHPGNILAIAFANRSAALYQSDHPVEALQNIVYALSLHYPSHLIVKLLRRRVSIYESLVKKDSSFVEKYVSATNDLKLFSNSLTSSDMLTIEQENILKDIILESQLTVSKFLKSDSRILGPLPQNKYETSPMILKNVGTSEERGIFANQYLNHGDYLYEEAPFAFILNESQRELGNLCHHCLRFCKYTFVGCDHCSEYIFCSYSCRDMAWKFYHEFECRRSICKDIKEMILAVRISLNLDRWPSRGMQDAFEPVYEMNLKSVHRNLVGGDENQVFHANSTTYKTLKGKPPHSNSLILSMAILAEMIPKVFSSIGPSSSVIFHNLCIQNLNSCRIKSGVIQNLSEKETPIIPISENSIGTGIYIKTSMLNHSCDPNAILEFSNGIVFLRAMKNIKMGDEITISYGPLYAQMGWQNRQNILLEGWGFQCMCQVCLKATETSQTKIVDGFLCGKYGCTFPNVKGDSQCQCGEVLNWDKIIQLYDFAKSQLCSLSPQRKSLAQKDSKICSTALAMLAKICHPQSQRLAQAYDYTASLLAEQGQYQESLLLVQKSLSIQIFHYGDSSIEVARERLKLAQLLVNAMKPDLAFQEVQKGLPILELLANRMDDDLVEMKRLDTNLQEMGFK